MSNESEADTDELPTIALSWAKWPEPSSEEVQVELAALSHPGLVRPNNEDQFLVMRFGRMLETVLSSLDAKLLPARFDEKAFGILVADGLGGGPSGELASRMAISTLLNLELATPDWIMSTEESQLERVMARMEERSQVVDTGRSSPPSAAPHPYERPGRRGSRIEDRISARIVGRPRSALAMHGWLDSDGQRRHDQRDPAKRGHRERRLQQPGGGSAEEWGKRQCNGGVGALSVGLTTARS
jgi:hypothetical protein